MCNSPHIISIHILDDNSLLNVFNFYRPFLLGEDENDNFRLMGGRGGWVRGRWWYRLAHVCQRWRNLIFGSSISLGLSLICTNGTPVAEMLAHSTPLPLDIDYSNEYQEITAEDEKGAILALSQRDRVRRVRLDMPVTSLQRFVEAIHEQYPNLEYLVIMHRNEDNSMAMTLPETLQAPLLRHLALIGFTLPIRSPLMMAGSLVTLGLAMNHPSTYFHPSTLRHWLSFMPQLETLMIVFTFPIPSRDIQTPLTPHTPVTLPNLRHFRFQGVSTYLEALIHSITAPPHLQKLQIRFFNQLTFSVPCLLQFMNITESLGFDSAGLEFSAGRVCMEVCPRGEAETHALSITVISSHLDWQVSAVAQISSSLRQKFSAVENLTLEHEVHNLSSEEHNNVNRTEWRKLLSSFSEVNTLRVDNGLVEQLSQCLQADDGETPLEPLPQLRDLTYLGSGNTGDAFTAFIDARQNAGHPVALSRARR